jgi:hypothetical protein
MPHELVRQGWRAGGMSPLFRSNRGLTPPARLAANALLIGPPSLERRRAGRFPFSADLAGVRAAPAVIPSVKGTIGSDI